MLPTPDEILKYKELSRKDLIALVKQLSDQTRKFGLVWENKTEEVIELCETKLPVLNEVVERHIERPQTADGSRQQKKTLLPDDDNNMPTHLIIEGDNYHALSVLNYTHAGKVDVIYIDPPYNTGAKDWKYNNNYVDSDDAYRHSKWLSFMEKRLILAKNLLTEDGIICVTIDDHELCTLGMLLDQVFGESNKAGIITVENNPRGRTANRFYATSHEFYLVYAKNAQKARAYNLPLTEVQKAEFKFVDDVSPYRVKPLRKSGADSRRINRPKQFYPIYINPETLEGSLDEQDGWTKILPIDDTGAERVWIIGIDKCNEFLKDGTIIIGKGKDKKNGFSLMVKDRIKAGRKMRSVWVDPRYDTSSHGATLLLKMFGKKVFDYPKSLWAVRDFIYTAISNKENAIILDFFAGSGTTGHAVLELNASDGCNRQFILCTNNENGIAENVTYPRIRKVIEGYADKKGIPAEVRYFRTEFVEKDAEEGITDAMRYELVDRAVDMLKIRENTFTLVERNEKRGKRPFEIYTNVAQTKYTAVIYDTSAIECAKAKIADIVGGSPVCIYIFTLSDDNYASDFRQSNWRVEPLPERILQVYRRLFAKNERKK